jgi:hypothetical protein
MIMFKHGVAYLERGGPAEGPFELSFKRAEMNDVLKSLAVWVGSGNARVGSVSFEAPEDPEAALAARKLEFDPAAALDGLLGSMRGRAVRVHAGGEPVEGQVIGLDSSGRRSLLLRADTGSIVVVDLTALERLELLEASARADLEYLVERSRAAMAGETRRVKVSISGRAEDLRVAYVIPAPVWRMSYRLVRQPDATLLMGWGIVHNPADEDLDDIELTLTTGQPVSFVIDLYQPVMVERAVVEAELRTVASPSRQAPSAAQLDSSLPAGLGSVASPPGQSQHPSSGHAPTQTIGGGDDHEPGRAGMGTMIMMAAAEAAGVPEGQGELFEYRVPHRITLKRGSSALVPVIAASVGARSERVWREAQGPHPDMVLSFANSTFSVLEEGPVVLYEAGAYVGEAMLPYTSRGGDVRLGYSRDLSLRCRRASRVDAQITGVKLTQGALIEELRREEVHTFSAESDHPDESEVLFEIPRLPQRAVDPAHAAPSEESASARRFRLKVPPLGRAELVAVERWADSRHVRYEQITQRDLSGWLEGRLLDRGTHDALAGVLQAWAQGRALDEQRARVEREQQDAFQRQQKLAEQLSTLKETGQEGALRQRYIKDMDREQERVTSCEGEVRKLREGGEQARKFAAQTLSVLVTHAERGRH